MEPRSPLPHSNTNALPPWSLAEVFVAFFLAFLVAPAVAFFILSWLKVSSTIYQLLVTQLAIYGAWAFILTELGKRYRVNLLDYLGLRRKESIPYYLWTGLASAGGIFLIGLLLGAVVDQQGWQLEQPYGIFPEEQLKVIAFFAIVLAPIPEEVVFRGFLQISLYRFMKPLAVIVLTSLLFTLFHSLYYGKWIAMIYVFLLGLLLSLVRHTTRSIIPCIIGHFLNNAMAALLLLR